MKIYDPEGRADAELAPLLRAPAGGLAERRIALLDNGKAGADFLLSAIAEGLASRSGASVVALRRKGSAATPCESDLLEQLVGEADLVLTGTAD